MLDWASLWIWEGVTVLTVDTDYFFILCEINPTLLLIFSHLIYRLRLNF